MGDQKNPELNDIWDSGIRNNIEYLKDNCDVQSPDYILKPGCRKKSYWSCLSDLFHHRSKLNLFVKRQTIFNEHLIRIIEMVQDNINDQFKTIDTQINSLIKSHEDLNNQLQNVVNVQQSDLNNIYNQFKTIDTQINSLIKSHEYLNNYIQNIGIAQKSDLKNTCDQFRKIDTEISNSLRKINEVDCYLKPQLSSELFNRFSPKADRFNYLDFENLFRGSEELIKQRQSWYVDYFKGKNKVLDLGSGRGEFLELLSAEGIFVTGVDNNEDMIQVCRNKGLNVIHSDIFDYLNSIPDDSLDGIFSAQVVEHLPFEKLHEFFRLAYNKLKDGGIFVVETVNPYNLSAFRFFFLDPSHQKPLFPEFVYFMCQSSGFKEILVKYISAETSSGKPCTEDNGGQWKYGDYAVIAEKHLARD
ncbi:O-antigen chain-terminating methyltransferase [Methanomicrobium sp. W14]|uniref:class I SAM-dependent methyltransferase n=1 Tax=Methanomicrobium sp. W14 TaxID=2817839 RepID=UPI001AE48596|nr:class I SAM-dependent methyltransferase [Methanomicrobium sp. W14]MBP2134454.1 O-antigen chain-terminating methyltransferase [Methanomicrobium sp. W14]